jgi:hypothetical protein
MKGMPREMSLPIRAYTAALHAEMKLPLQAAMFCHPKITANTIQAPARLNGSLSLHLNR